MEMAKVTSKGQITIPVSIRRRLGINEGDKLLFIDRPEGVMMVNPDMLPGNRAEVNMELETQTSEFEDEGAAPVKKATAPTVSAPVAAPAPASAPAAPPPQEKPGPQVHGLDLNALLNEIRSIGSNI